VHRDDVARFLDSRNRSELSQLLREGEEVKVLGAVLEEVAEGLLKENHVEGSIGDGGKRLIGEGTGVGGVQQTSSVCCGDVEEDCLTDGGIAVRGGEYANGVAVALQGVPRSHWVQRHRVFWSDPVAQLIENVPRCIDVELLTST
jgi:hypothetical protein